MIDVKYYLGDHTFDSVSCDSSNLVTDFLKKIEKKNYPVILKGEELDEEKTFEDLIDKLRYNALLVSGEPSRELFLPDKQFNLDDYRDIIFINNKSYKKNLCTAINKKTGQKVLITVYENKDTSAFSNLTCGIYIMAMLDFPTIPKILGYSFALDEKSSEIFYRCSESSNVLVTKFNENGTVIENVINYFKTKGDQKSNKMNPTNRSKIIFGVAATMKYLHEKQIYHRFLKAENVFLDENFEPVVSDFRFAQFWTCKEKEGEMPHTVDEYISNPYILAPESYDCSTYSTRSDVFMYAIFLYMMFSIKEEILLDDKKKEKKKPTCFQIMERIYDGARPIRLDTIPDHYWDLIQRCWQKNPLDRPSFNEIVDILKDDKFALEEFGMKTDLKALHEYQNRVDSNEVTRLKAEVSALKKKLELIENPKNPKSDEFKMEIIDSLMISKLRTIKEISIGGFARVLEVGKEESYALKVMHSNEFDIKQIRNFIKEYELLLRLKHPFIVQSFGIFMGDEKNPPSILLEYCLNDMKKAIKDDELDNETIVKWIYQIVEAMRYVHKLGIIHRDLKPSNILIAKDGSIRVSDFGISKLMSTDEQTTTLGAGTQFFMAPEIFNDEKYNEKSDVYSFGVLLYFILSRGSMPKITIIQIGTGIKAKIPSDFTPFAKDLINNCWNFKPDERPSFEKILELMETNDYKLLELSKSQISAIKKFVDLTQTKIPK